MKNNKEIFIINYLKKHVTVDACNENFHDEFFNQFGGKRKQTFFGAQPIYKAMRLLSKMYKENKIDRTIISLPDHLSGFPNWIYVYSLKE